jgi:YfiH family protein
MEPDIAEVSNLFVYRFPHLAEFTEIRHGIFTRRAGFSQPPYNGLNISVSVGDAPIDTRRNRLAVSGYFDGNELFFLHQVHGSDIIFLDTDRETAARDQKIPTGDAAITNIPGKVLVVQVADCQPVLLFDPVQKVIAAVHSGWRGSLQNIIGKTIAAMADRFQCQPADIRAGIGPSLGPCCSEFIHYRQEIPKPFWKYQKAENHFDFWELSRDQLQEAGVSRNHIHISGLCTKCRHDLFFSYRRQKVTGRFAGAIVLNNNPNRSDND